MVPGTRVELVTPRSSGECSIRDRHHRLCGDGESCIASPEGDTATKKPTMVSSFVDLAYQLSYFFVPGTRVGAGY